MTSQISTRAVNEAGLSINELKQLMDIAKQASMEGGKILMQLYGKLNMIRSKGREGDLVTNADILAEKVVIKVLKELSPQIPILAEESGSIGQREEMLWCVDPLDGTTNFAHGYPFFATSIGLTYKNVPIIGAIDIPFIGETYWCAPHIGAFCNENLIKVSETDKLSNSLLVTGFAYDRQTRLDNNYSEFCWMTHRTRGVRRGGAAAVDLAFVAAGRLDGYWERGLSKWDLAAGVVLVEQAGGNVSDYAGKDFDLNNGRVIACSNGIKDEFISELSKAKPMSGEIFGAPELRDMGS